MLPGSVFRAAIDALKPKTRKAKDAVTKFTSEKMKDLSVS